MGGANPAFLPDKALTRYGLEEYVADCVILLDVRVQEQISTRRLRIVEYRGSSHGSDEYPFLIDERGVSILPISSLGLDYPVSTERISTGVPKLDAMKGNSKTELAFQTGGENVAPVLLSASPLQLTDMPGAVCAVMVDITERKKMDGEL
jgi:hypothetical protein